ncbi:MAG: hypothetical protein LJE92_08185 [Gammaproteobacteria bacterium]|jgi:Ca2+-binding RTX toxin-like protein|nr:hypothetical protein [Gammaproteobacteria bacterium]
MNDKLQKILEQISRISTFTTLLTLGVLALSLLALSLPRVASANHCGNAGCSANADLAFDTEDLKFILDQIRIAERHAAGENLADLIPNKSLPWGLRTVDGSFNNLIPGQEDFGAADLEFPVLGERDFPPAQNGTSYLSGQTVQDSTPRLISHLIVNQSSDNPAAVAAAIAEGGVNIGPDITGIDQYFIPNTGPDAALSAPTNAFMTFFGQFFDHGLDLVNKGGNGVVMIPLQPDDPLYDPTPGAPNFMIMPRATRGAGADGIVGTADDTFVNATTPHVDQQQTYASEASSQILLRHYEVRNGVLQDSGRLLNGYGVDRVLDSADDGGMATWDTARAQARLKFGIDLDDHDGNNIPMILADPYGNFIPGPVSGLPQLVTAIVGGIPTLLEGNLATPVDASQALRVNHSFFLDVAHTAAPEGLPDVDTVINPRTDVLSGQATRGIRASSPAGFYDDELLGAHFVCGDGRCNENIALSTVHSIFHHEHNRLVEVTKRVLLDAGDLVLLNEFLDAPVAVFPAWAGLPFPISDAALTHQAQARVAIAALNLDWNGKRIFQAARFGTEMQYNRIVFDEFAPTIAGLKDVFTGFHTSIDPAITAEFSQSVYRFGHSMLTETVDRYDANFNPIVEAVSGDPAQLGLFEAFLNPLALYNADANGVPTLDPEAATGAVIRGLTRTTANEIDEFVTGALQNNLVGLPLDLGALNIARGRDVGNPSLNAARRMFYSATADSRLTPYAHWADYADNLRHEASLVNFIAAYGTHVTLAGVDGIVGNADDPYQSYAERRAAACAIVGELTTINDLTPDPAAYCVRNGFGTPPPTPADAMDFLYSMGAWQSDANGRTITGLDDVDFWNGGLAEERMPFGGYLGSTHNYVFESQMESLQNGDRFYYVGRTANLHLLAELESNTFTALAMRSTDLGEQDGGKMSLNIFLTADAILEVDQAQQFNATGDGTTADPTGTAELTPLVIRDASLATTNVFIADTTRFLQFTGAVHATINGTSGDDTILGGIDDDTILGGAGNDRIDAGDGPDLVEGGSGDDIITDLGGMDVIQGGAGNDAISSGNEADVIFGDEGNDFIVNPSEFGEIFAGLGDDYILDGPSNSHIRGGAGADWMENLGGGADLFQGDNGAAPEAGEPPIKGHDVFINRAGNADGDMESGDDIYVDGPGIDRVVGQLGFDWVSFANDRFGVDVDLDLFVLEPPKVPSSNATVLNRYDRVEGLSGSRHSDVLRGTPNQFGVAVVGEVGIGIGGGPGNELVNFDLITGLSELVPLSERADLPNDPVTGEAQFGWADGEIILGGAGSDLMVGEGGDDIIDGDAALAVMIATPDPAIRTGPEWVAYRAARSLAVSTASQAEKDAKAALAFVEAGEAAQLALDAATASATAAIAAADAAAAALTNDITVKSEVTNFISGGRLSGARLIQRQIWQDFVNRCGALLIDLDMQLQETTADTAAEAVALQAQAVAKQIASQQSALEATAAASALAAETAQVDLVVAQAALPADVMTLVPSMEDLLDAVFEGFINPGELSISRVISDNDPTDIDTDTAVFQGKRLNYTINVSAVPGFIMVTDNRNFTNLVGVGGGIFVGNGRDLLRNVERLKFEDETVIVGNLPGRTENTSNSVALGQAAVTGIAEVPNTLTASIANVTDADNVSVENPAGAINTPVAWTWESELRPGSEVFTPIIRVGINGIGATRETNPTLVLTAAEAGLRVRVQGIFKDDAQVLEMVHSTPLLVAGDPLAPPGPVAGAFLSIQSATFSTRQLRLRVDGTVGPIINTTLALFAPGTTDLNGNCTGSFLANLTFAPDGTFSYDSGGGGFAADPVSVCVSSNNGLTTAVPTTLN